MDIDKIKNYNQRVLAVLVTISSIMAMIGLIMIVVAMIDDLSRSTNQDDGIMSDDKIEELQSENRRQQLISYETPRLVDTLNLIYIVPVSHKTLSSAEFIEFEEENFDFSGGKIGAKMGRRYSRRYYGDFNNLLIYDYKSQKTEKLITDRINFRSIETEYFEDDILVLFKGATEDTYKDGVINQLDYKTLFIYSLINKKLSEVKLEGADITQINFVENSKDLLINFGVDHNKDGTFDQSLEPSLVKRYNYAKGELVDLVPHGINRELQMNLEGTKSN